MEVPKERRNDRGMHRNVGIQLSEISDGETTAPQKLTMVIYTVKQGGGIIPHS